MDIIPDVAKKKILLLVLDGLGDRECEGRTPLESAVHPNLDELSATGVNGLMYTIAPGVVPGSDTAHLAMFGYDPQKFYSGRGAYEALGAGIELKRGDVAFRCNFATIDSSGRVVDRRAGRIEDTHPLEPAIQKIKLAGAKTIFKSTAKHRAVLVLRGAGLSRMVSDVDSHGLGNLQKCMPLEKGAARTAKLVNDFVKKSHDVLKDAPFNRERRESGMPEANVVLPRGAGTLPEVESFQKRYGMKGACIAGGAMYKGVARALGMDIIDVEGATAGVDTNIEGKVKAAAGALDSSEYDFVFLHIKGCDVMGHDGNFDGKAKFIEKVDGVLGPLMGQDDLVLCVTGDHSTPCELRDHSADPVPLLIANCGRTDGVRMFGEKPCASGSLGAIMGTDLMPLLLGAANRARMFGT